MADHDLTERDISDLIEDAHTKALHLHAMLTTITGNGGRSFRTMDEGLQDNYIWACQRMAEEVTNIIEKANSDYLVERVQRSEVQHG